MPRTILIVDDQAEERALLKEQFERAGYRVELAADGNEAISAALKSPPDIILLDLVMPGLDGWDAIKVLRSYSPTRAIPIVVCSGSDEEGLARAADAGCEAVVEKPCLADRIEQVIDEVLRRGASVESDAG